MIKPLEVTDEDIQRHLGNEITPGKGKLRTKIPLSLFKTVQETLEVPNDPFLVAVHFGIAFEPVCRVANNLLKKRCEAENREFVELPTYIRDYLILAAEWECHSQPELTKTELFVGRFKKFAKLVIDGLKP